MIYSVFSSEDSLLDSDEASLDELSLETAGSLADGSAGAGLDSTEGSGAGSLAGATLSLDELSLEAEDSLDELSLLDSDEASLGELSLETAGSLAGTDSCEALSLDGDAS